jgi:hypothetical protein
MISLPPKDGALVDDRYLPEDRCELVMAGDPDMVKTPDISTCSDALGVTRHEAKTFNYMHAYSGGLLRAVILQLKDDQCVFERYAALHEAKGTQEGHEKAVANFHQASKITALLSQLKAAGYD